MLKQRTFKYEDSEYLITSFPAFGGERSGFRIKADLAKLIVPFFADLRGEGDLIEGKSPIQIAIEHLMNRLDSQDAEFLVLRMITGVTKNGMNIDPSMEFSGDYAKLYHLLYQIVDLNYGNLFTLLGSNASLLGMGPSQESTLSE